MDSSTAALALAPDPLAHWLGAHAWQLFALVLPLLAGVVVALALAWRHPRRPLRAPDAPSLAWLLATLAVGFGVVVALASGFAEIAEALGDSQALGHWDDSFSRAVGLHTPLAVQHAFALLTRLADPWPMTVLGVVVALALWWRGHRVDAAGWVLAMVGNTLLNLALKQVFARTRPLHEDGIISASGYSFPSGHSSGAVVAYGMLAFLACRLLPARWHLPALVAAALLSVTAAWSRVLLRVHFPSDVLAGLLSGSSWLAVCILAVTAAHHHARVRADRANRSAGLP